MRAKFSKERFDKTVKKIVEDFEFCATNIRTNRRVNRFGDGYVYDVYCDISYYLTAKHIEDIQKIATGHGLKLSDWELDFSGMLLMLLFTEQVHEQ